MRMERALMIGLVAASSLTVLVTSSRPETPTASSAALQEMAPTAKASAATLITMGSSDHIFTMWFDGSHLRRVTHKRGGTDVQSALSPNSRRIAYQRNVTNHAYLQVVNRFTGDVQRLSNQDMAWPAWSPGGRRIAAEQLIKSSGRGKLVMVDARTHRVRPLGATGWLQAEPAWSPDGKLLVFAGDAAPTGPPASLETITPRGHHQRVLFQGTRDAMSPSWSPDGRHIVFAQFGVQHPQVVSWSRIITVRADGTHRHVVLGKSIRAYRPAYTPDGRWIVFQRGRGTAWAVHPNGSGLHRMSTVSVSYPRPGF